MQQRHRGGLFVEATVRDSQQQLPGRGGITGGDQRLRKVVGDAWVGGAGGRGRLEQPEGAGQQVLVLVALWLVGAGLFGLAVACRRNRRD